MKPLRGVLSSEATPRHQRVENLATRIHGVLASHGWTLSEVSRESRMRYPHDKAYWIPHHFYADLQVERFSPRTEQILAFSAISNYRFVDWLAVFGFDLDSAPRLATSFHTERTVLLDATIYDDQAWMPWFQNRSIGGLPRPIAPLGQLIEFGALRLLKSLLSAKPSPFLYAKVGRQDAFLFPDLLPGSIVRVDTRPERKRLDLGVGATSNSLFLVEHSKGLTCCRLHVSKRYCITIRSTQLPYAQVELQLGREARILGGLDMEFRFLANGPSPEVPHDLAAFWTPQPLPPLSEKYDLAQLIARGRRRAGLSLREASARTLRIAEVFGDERYYCSRGTLSEYETMGKMPRHIHKILAVCVLYSLGFWHVLDAAGFETRNLAQDPIPTGVFGRYPSFLRTERVESGADLDEGGFLQSLVEEFEEIPFFLRNSLGVLTGLRDLSLRDMVWLGGRSISFHPYLSGALLAAVNRRYKRPLSAVRKPQWQQPLYLLLQRDGSYLCARCNLEKDRFVVHPFANGFDRPVRLRKGVDAEVIGKIVALVRRL